MKKIIMMFIVVLLLCVINLSSNPIIAVDKRRGGRGTGRGGMGRGGYGGAHAYPVYGHHCRGGGRNYGSMGRGGYGGAHVYPVYGHHCRGGRNYGSGHKVPSLGCGVLGLIIVLCFG